VDLGFPFGIGLGGCFMFSDDFVGHVRVVCVGLVPVCEELVQEVEVEQSECPDPPGVLVIVLSQEEGFGQLLLDAMDVVEGTWITSLYNRFCLELSDCWVEVEPEKFRDVPRIQFTCAAGMFVWYDTNIDNVDVRVSALFRSVMDEAVGVLESSDVEF
jgi:hypothetical protein